MKKYLIPRKYHQDLYIFEGHLYDFSIVNDQLNIIINGVEYPSLPEEIITPDYLDKVKISFKGFSYLKFDICIESPGNLQSSFKFGEVKDSENLLDYSGGWGEFGDFDVPSGFFIEIICQDIELEFMD